MLAPLWFDVEVRYNTTVTEHTVRVCRLWFDVEVRYNTTAWKKDYFTSGCGLM